MYHEQDRTHDMVVEIPRDHLVERFRYLRHERRCNLRSGVCTDSSLRTSHQYTLGKMFHLPVIRT